MLNELSKHNDKLYEMARTICLNEITAQDLVQDTYLKLYESKKKFEDINFVYIYFTMKSIFFDSVKKSSLKNREIQIDDIKFFENININQDEFYEIETTINQIKIKDANRFENLLIDALCGKNITNEENKIVRQVKGTSMLDLSNKTGIHYNTIYKTWQKIKNKVVLEELETLSLK